jgi:hypothetical protein
MTYYIFCASNVSIPGILCISYFQPSCGTLKETLDFLNRKTPMFEIILRTSKGKNTPYEKYRQLPTPYNFVFIKKWGERGEELSDTFNSDVWETIIRELKQSKLNIVNNNENNVIGFGGIFIKNSIEEVKVLFDHIEGDYVNYLIEDTLIKKERYKKIINDRIMKEQEDNINKEIEDMIINNYFKTLEDTLYKKKGELERLDVILSKRKAEIDELNN